MAGAAARADAIRIFRDPNPQTIDFERHRRDKEEFIRLLTGKSIHGDVLCRGQRQSYIFLYDATPRAYHGEENVIRIHVITRSHEDVEYLQDDEAHLFLRGVYKVARLMNARGIIIICQGIDHEKAEPFKRNGFQEIKAWDDEIQDRRMLFKATPIAKK